MRWTPADLTQWRRWFAWHPVRIGSTWVWLEDVQRREVLIDQTEMAPSGEPWTWTVKVPAWEYR